MGWGGSGEGREGGRGMVRECEGRCSAGVHLRWSCPARCGEASGGQM
jgi:hypothetical protein